MAILESLIPVLQSILEPVTLLLIAGGVLYGIIFGVIPGLGPILAVTLLIPVSFVLDPLTAISTMAAAYVGSVYGGSISAILLNIPGEATSVATTFDGYPMTKDGRSNIALGASVTSSFIGGIISVIALMMFAPLLGNLAVQFGAIQFFALGLFGLVVVTAVTRGSLLQGGVATVIGLIAGTVGVSEFGFTRFTFGTDYLASGVPLVPLVVGLFAVSEAILLLYQGEEQIVDEEGDEGDTPLLETTGKISDGVRQTLSRSSAVLRSTAIGIGIGIIPGIGASLANFVAYFHIESTSPDGDRFGQGIIDGVIGPEASNNAVTAAALVPTLVLGIPGNATTAVLLSALQFNQIRIGPLLFSETPVFAYSFFASILLANVFMFGFGYVLSSRFAKITRISTAYVAPAVLIMSILGVFVVNFSALDSIVALLIGVVTVLFRRFGFPPVNILFGYILAPIIEENFHRVFRISGGDPMIFFTSPSALFLYGLSLLTILTQLYPLVMGRTLLSHLRT